jgi:hypothetical protein
MDEHRTALPFTNWCYNHNSATTNHSSFCQHDKAIMDSTILSRYPKSEQEMINACRLFLKVNTLAEITNHQGSKILDCVRNCALSSEGHPTLHEISKSKLQWPYQTRPPRKQDCYGNNTYHHLKEKTTISLTALDHGITMCMNNGRGNLLRSCQTFFILTITHSPGMSQDQVAPDIDYSSPKGTSYNIR